MNASTGYHPTPAAGELLAIADARTSGKSTPLNTPSSLARPSADQVPANQHDPLNPSNQALAQHRRHNLGFVWPAAARNLLPYLISRGRRRPMRTMANPTHQQTATPASAAYGIMTAAIMDTSTGYHSAPAAGEPSAIASADASGKNTLLNTPAGLDRPSAGYVRSGQHDPHQLQQIPRLGA